MKPPADPTIASQPAPVVRTSPAAVRALRAAREGTSSPALAAPPPCFAPTPLCAAILFALPAAGSVAMDTAFVVLALRSGDPAHDLTIEDVAAHLVALCEAGLVRAFARPGDAPEAMRWTRSERGDALPVVRERYRADDGEEQA